MIYVNFPEPQSDDWKRWRNECDHEQLRLNESYSTGTPIKINEHLYKGERYSIKKKYYINPKGYFKGKCIFCEQIIYRDQYGDMEHYRPKASVKELDNKPIKILINGHEQDHPGYYWLAYDWQNLLPSCKLCNGPYTDIVSQKPIGKRNYFPVRGFRAEKPGDEVREEPLLINPIFENPEQSMKMLDSGELKGLDDKGGMSIRILGLNDRDLPSARIEEYTSALNLLRLKGSELFNSPSLSGLDDFLKAIRRIKEGYFKFTIAGRKAIADYFTKERNDVLRALLAISS